MFWANITVMGLNDEHCDVIKAFTQNKLDDCKLYLEQPPGIDPVLDDEGKPMIMEAIMDEMNSSERAGSLRAM